MNLFLSLHDAIAIECALRGAATDLRMEADESERMQFHRSAAIKRREAAEADRLSRVMKAAVDAAIEPKRVA